MIRKREAWQTTDSDFCGRNNVLTPHDYKFPDRSDSPPVMCVSVAMSSTTMSCSCVSISSSEHRIDCEKRRKTRLGCYSHRRDIICELFIMQFSWRREWNSKKHFNEVVDQLPANKLNFADDIERNFFFLSVSKLGSSSDGLENFGTISINLILRP